MKFLWAKDKQKGMFVNSLKVTSNIFIELHEWAFGVRGSTKILEGHF